MAPRLSVCIPTHDGRRHALKQLLESVLAQLPELPKGTVDICITDNHSEDGTDEMVAELAAAYPETISYRRHDADLGAMRNIFSSVDLATGEYCWLVSSDDALAPGALKFALEVLDDAPGVTGMTLNWATYDEQLRGVAYDEIPEILPAERDRSARYLSFDEFMRECGVVLGYLSIQIIRRERWLGEVKGHRDSLLGHEIFAQTLALGQAAKRNPDWIWRPEVMVKNRANNSVWVGPKGLYRYHLDTTRDLTSVWRKLVGTGSTYRSLLRKWYRLCLSPRWLVVYKLEAHPRTSCDREMLVELTRSLWRAPSIWLRVLPVLLTPRALLARSSRLRAGLEALDG